MKTYQVTGVAIIYWDCDCPDCKDGLHYEEEKIDDEVEATTTDEAIAGAEWQGTLVSGGDFAEWKEPPIVKEL